MAFIQIIEYETSNPDKVKLLGDEWEAATAGKRKAGRRILTKDRDHPGRYYNIVFFDSYEEAMENSKLPETSDFAGRMMELADGPATFYNLDVEEDSQA